jgi:hypothetical protein
MYPFMTLNDDTEIVHSETLPDGRVRVYIETPDSKDGFHHMTIFLPDYQIAEVYRYTADEVKYYVEYIKSLEQIIIQLAAQGGFENASCV